MKLGVFAVLFGQQKLEEALAYISEAGAQAVEIGTGGYPGNAHANPEELLNDPTALQNFKDAFKKYNLEISALSVHGNPVHPNKEVAAGFIKDFKNTVKLAEKLGINRVVTFSGCPGDSPTSQYPNWVTCPWPDDFLKILDYQWNEVLIPYWTDEVKFAADYGVDKIALEMHPGFCVYNTESLLKLRNAVGKSIGANYDPSHLFWQGNDPAASIRALGDAIYYVHAKDSKVDPINAGVKGVLDTRHYADEINRSWLFRTVGYGHSYEVWNDIISTLRLVGYDDVISIEHEDSLMSVNEGLMKAVEFLKKVLVFEGKGEMWWA